jgi:hypothetical protein
MARFKLIKKLKFSYDPTTGNTVATYTVKNGGRPLRVNSFFVALRDSSGNNLDSNGNTLDDKFGYQPPVGAGGINMTKEGPAFRFRGEAPLSADTYTAWPAYDDGVTKIYPPVIDGDPGITFTVN